MQSGLSAMRKKGLLFPFMIIVLLLHSCEKEGQWISLFNGQNLDNWDKYIGSPLKGMDSLARKATTENVFSVVNENGTGLIRIAGYVNGSLATKEKFGNYHLRMVFRWGDSVYATRNSGLLYQSTGNFGEALGTWMTNIEFQLMHGNMGDTYLMNNTTCESEVLQNDTTSKFTYTPGEPSLLFGEQANGRSVKKSADFENPPGEWNSVELFCVGSTAVHVVNGIAVMLNRNTGLFENGEIQPLTSGKIQIQSEGAELYIKSIEIRPIRKIPEEIIPR
jgi:hypothetical protein